MNFARLYAALAAKAIQTAALVAGMLEGENILIVFEWNPDWGFEDFVAGVEDMVGFVGDMAGVPVIV